MTPSVPPSQPGPQPLCAAFAPLLPLLAASELDAEQEAAARACRGLRTVPRKAGDIRRRGLRLTAPLW